MRKPLLLVACVMWLMLFREQPVLGYLDPGSGSMLLQLLLGGVAGAAVIGRLYWQRLLALFSGRQKR